jgi:glycosidase
MAVVSRVVGALTVAMALAVSGCSGTEEPAVPTGGPVALGEPVVGDVPWWNERVFYEVFVRSCADSDGDGIGDLRGLISRLDHLNDGDPATEDDLGVTGSWLMPITQSPSYHRYDTTDYYRVEEDYGNNADFRALVDQAHERGMAVIVDLMLNHTSIEHPWFLDSASSPDSPKRDWYVWSDEARGDTAPWSGAVATQDGDPDSLLSRYRRLVDLRAEHAALRVGGLRSLDGPCEDVHAHLRAPAPGDDAEPVLVLLNFAEAEQDGCAVEAEDSGLAPGSYAATDLLTGRPAAGLTVEPAGAITQYRALDSLAARQGVVLGLTPQP